jgi:K+-sensing histidine kinase KdpD
MQSIDVLASAIHDAKNQLFFADNLAATTAAEHGLELDAMREAMERASLRLTRALLAYRLESGVQPLSISAVAVHGLLEDAALICGSHYEHLGLTLESRCEVEGVWPLDRDLILDVINNGLENAARFARSKVVLSAQNVGDLLFIRIEDDGPGFISPRAPQDKPGDKPENNSGLGLHIGGQIARMHQRHSRHGSLELRSGGNLGGALFELALP